MQASTEDEIRKQLINRMSQIDFIVSAVHQAAKKALEDHKHTGDPIAGWENHAVVWIAAEDIHVEET